MDSCFRTLETEVIAEKKFKPPNNWLDAPEFIPKSVTNLKDSEPLFMYQQNKSSELCSYAILGVCRYGEKCVFLHGELCELCGKACLHPIDKKQREEHNRECIKQHEKDMELSFAIARSNDKTCGICMEVIMEKSNPGEQRFGILPSCNHCFCLSCIRRWRRAKQFENKIIRACPECRTTSDFVCPSRFWVETKDEKEKLFHNYRVALSYKPCRYYKNGNGECPFGNKCFYRHALTNGMPIDIGPPKRKPRNIRQNGTEVHVNTASIWDFLEEWEMRWMDIDDLMDMLESDGSDISDEFDYDYIS